MRRRTGASTWAELRFHRRDAEDTEAFNISLNLRVLCVSAVTKYELGGFPGYHLDAGDVQRHSRVIVKVHILLR